jgi:hypothetical protein
MLRERPEDDIDENGERRLNADYLALAREHAQRQRFTRDPVSGAFPTGALCVLCREIEPAGVFFPCEHRCVCAGCVTAHAIGPPQRGVGGEQTSGAAPETQLRRPQEQSGQHRREAQVGSEERWPFCPLCLQEILLVLPYQNGGEVEQYWRWVHKVRQGVSRCGQSMCKLLTDTDCRYVSVRARVFPHRASRDYHLGSSIALCAKAASSSSWSTSACTHALSRAASSSI